MVRRTHCLAVVGVNGLDFGIALKLAEAVPKMD
jgi:hypothetical protein